MEKAIYKEHFDKQMATIMKVATDLARQKGIDNISISDIAKACGLTRPTIYRYFSGKDDIFWAIFFETQNTVMERILEKKGPNDTIIERLSMVASIMREEYQNNLSFSVYNEVFMTLYSKACEDKSYNWQTAQNLYNFRPGRSVNKYIGDIVDLDANPEVRNIVVSFIYAFSALLKLGTSGSQAIENKYGIQSNELLDHQTKWLLEGAEKELAQLGF